MNIIQIQNKVEKFEKERRWNKTSDKDIIKFIEEEIKEFKVAKLARKKEKIYDMFREVIQLANRYNMNLEKTFIKGIKISEKKYPVIK